MGSPTRLEAFMKDNNIPPMALVRASGISRQYLLRLRQGKAEPRRAIIAALVEELRENGDDALDNDFSLRDFLDRFGMRLGQLGNIINLVGPLAEASSQSESSGWGPFQASRTRRTAFAAAGPMDVANARIRGSSSQSSGGYLFR